MQVNMTEDKIHHPAAGREAEIASTVKLLKFVITCTITFILILQFASLLHQYFNKNSGISHSLSKEDVSAPSLSICIKLSEHLKEEVLQRYDVDNSAFNFELNDIESKWQDFPWSEKTIDQLYADAAIYPYHYLTDCQAGGKSCMEETGNFYHWVNRATGTKSCSTLALKETIKPGEYYIYVEMSKAAEPEKPEDYIYRDFIGETKSDIYPQFLVHELTNQLLPYTEHNMVVQNKMNSYIESNQWYPHAVVRIAKNIKLKKNNKNECVDEESYNQYQCLETCIEQYILSDGGCTLPWMPSNGRTCKNSSDFVNTIRRDTHDSWKRLCPCPQPCISWQLISDLGTYKLRKNERPAFGVVINTKEGIDKIEELLMLTDLEMLAAAGGTLGILIDVSVPMIFGFILQYLILAASTFGSQILKVRSTKRDQNKLEFLCLIAFQGLCLAIFCYQGFKMIYQYQESPKLISIQAKVKNRAFPPLLFCTNERNFSFDWNYVEKYGKEYVVQYLYISPRLSMLKCTLKGEDCRAERGKYHKWTRELDVGFFCDVLQITSLIDSSDFMTNEVLSCSYKNNYVVLIQIGSHHSQATIYSIVNSPRLSDVIQTETRFSYSVQETWNLSPCFNSYQFMNDTLVKIYTNTSTVGCVLPVGAFHNSDSLKLCASEDQFHEFNSDFTNALIMLFIEPWTVQQPCSQVEYTFYTLISNKNFVRNITTVDIELLPATEFSKEERWKTSSSQLIGALGGLLGLLTGWTAIFIMQWAIQHIGLITCKKPAEIILVSASSLVRASFWIIFLMECYNSLWSYLQNTTITQRTLKDKANITIPVITLCLTDRKIWEVGQGNNLVTRDFSDFFGGRQVITPTSSEDLQKHLPIAPFHSYKELKQCYILGHSCLQENGTFHGWTYSSLLNTHCSVLRTNLTYLSDDVKETSITIQLANTNSDFSVYVTDAYHLPSLYQDVRLKGYFLQDKDFAAYQISFSSLKRIKNGKFEDCNEDLNYNFKECLEECIDAYVLSNLNCTFPWRREISGHELCYRKQDFLFLDHMDYTFVNQCPCKKSCYIKRLHTEKLEDTMTSSTIKLMLSDEEWEYEEIQSYSFLKLFSDLGGALVTLTGLTIYHIIDDLF